MDIRRLILGTRNQGKVAEFKLLLATLDVPLAGLAEFPQVPEVVEDGSTFEANAAKKAVTWARALGDVVLADDSGLEVKVLAGRPGVHSARYAGPQQDAQANVVAILEQIRNVPAERRGARFVCVLALATPDGLAFTVRGACEGFLTDAPRGTGGFGYDPIFLVPEYAQTFGELSADVKNRISHRARAIQLFRDKFVQWRTAAGVA